MALGEQGDRPQGGFPTRPASVDTELSYDPHSWFARPEAAPAEGPMPPPPRREGMNAGAASLVSALILLAGAGVAYRDRTPHAVRPAATPSAVVAGDSHHILTIASIADLASSLDATGIDPREAGAASALAVKNFVGGPGNLRLGLTLRGSRLVDLDVAHDTGAGVTVTTDGHGGFTAQRHDAKLVTRLAVVRGELDARSFYSSAVVAGINDALVSDFANAFAFDFDLQREVAPGDVIEAGFEQRFNAGGDPVGLPVLVYASLETKAKSLALYRFTDPATGKAGWYDMNGRSTVRALMRTPIDGARISSQFGLREHPILGFVKLHKGTDFAAPVGTPIFAAGDATVEFAGPKGPNGNFVKLRHGNGWETLYLHMNRIWPGVVAGARVRQGQQLGEVGTTGRSTGPHLHYEVHVGGEPVDPLSLDTGVGMKALTGGSLAAFRQLRDRIDTRRAAIG